MRFTNTFAFMSLYMLSGLNFYWLSLAIIKDWRVVFLLLSFNLECDFYSDMERGKGEGGHIQQTSVSFAAVGVHLVLKKKAAAKKRSINTSIFLHIYILHTFLYSQGQIVYSLYIYFAVLCASAPNSPAFNLPKPSFGWGWLCLHWT